MKVQSLCPQPSENFLFNKHKTSTRQEVQNFIFLRQIKCLLDHGPQRQLPGIKKSTIGNSILSIHYVWKSIFHSDLLGFYGLEVKRSFVKLLKNVMANLVGWFFTCAFEALASYIHQLSHFRLLRKSWLTAVPMIQWNAEVVYVPSGQKFHAMLYSRLLTLAHSSILIELSSIYYFRLQ